MCERILMDIQKIFEKEYDEYLKEAISDVQKSCKQSALLATIVACKDYLPQQLVATLPWEYQFMHYIGELDSARIFYKQGNLFLSSGESKSNGIPLVKSFDFSERGEEVMRLLQKINFSETAHTEKVIPSGFYLFRFIAQWAAGGYDDGPVAKELIICGKNFKEATNFLAARLSNMHENCFWNFTAEFDGQVNILHTRQGKFKDRSVYTGGFGPIKFFLFRNCKVKK